MAEPLLVGERLTRRFGGLSAVRAVDIALERGSIHALIGPNGAGKSTLINLLSGDLPPSEGSIRLRDEDVTALPAHRRARYGIGRSYQKTNVFGLFTAFENCRLAAQARRPRPWSVHRAAEAFEDVNATARRSLALAGLASRAEVPAFVLSHGEQRQLEVAMLLATDPQVLLLDEPLAGMGAEESARMVELIRGLREGHAILLVEHDMDAVFAVADRLTVMVNGEVLASGEPAAIRANAEVQMAYLGHGGVEP
jgi:branched-chain amino acid transport system ATP-binding protein